MQIKPSIGVCRLNCLSLLDRNLSKFHVSNNLQNMQNDSKKRRQPPNMVIVSMVIVSPAIATKVDHIME